MENLFTLFYYDLELSHNDMKINRFNGCCSECRAFSGAQFKLVNLFLEITGWSEVFFVD